MQETQTQLIDFLTKAYELTRQALKHAQNHEFTQLSSALDNRERAINIVHSLSERLSLHQKSSQNPQLAIEFNNQVSRVIDKINQLDEIITSCLEHEKNKTQFEIAKTFKNKENFRGYNLNKTK